MLIFILFRFHHVCHDEGFLSYFLLLIELQFFGLFYKKYFQIFKMIFFYKFKFIQKLISYLCQKKIKTDSKVQSIDFFFKYDKNVSLSYSPFLGRHAGSSSWSFLPAKNDLSAPFAHTKMLLISSTK